LTEPIAIFDCIAFNRRFRYGAVALSFFLQARADALIILTIVLASALLSFSQERGAADAVEKLLAIVQTKTTVLRDGRPQEVPVEEIVPGDVVILRAGDLIPGDCRLLDAKDLFVDEAALTGETYPVEKAIGALAPEISMGQRTNVLFLGTHVVSGTATAAVVYTGKDSEFGQVSERLRLRPPETEFDRGVKHFGYFLEDEVDMTFLGFLVFFDPSKPGINDIIAQLRWLGVSLKIITGDNQLVAANVSQHVGLANARILSGPELRQMSDEALYRRVNAVDGFAEVEPN
jgi:magnesium-transporting ATPase (P-type)